MMPIIRIGRGLDGRLRYAVKINRRGTWQRCDKWWAEVALRNRMAKVEAKPHSGK